MEARDIPSEQWLTFINDFSRSHAGDLVSIEVLDNEMGPQHIVDHIPLLGISLDTRGTRPSSLEIAAGDEQVGLIRHVIDLPLAIHMAGGEAEREVALEIEPAHGPKTLVVLGGQVH